MISPDLISESTNKKALSKSRSGPHLTLPDYIRSESPDRRVSSAYLSYTGGMPSRKIRPIVQIATNGDLKTTMEVKQNKSDFNRN